MIQIADLQFMFLNKFLCDPNIFLFQISDDEDDTHPNVDTPSLFKWRHEARVEKMKEMEQEKQTFLKEKNE